MGTLVGTISTSLDLSYTGAVDVGSVVHTIRDTSAIHFTSGTGANQGDALWADTRSLNASTSEDLDLSGGITDALGTLLTLTAVKAIRVRAAASNGGLITIGGAAATQFVGPFGAATHTIALPAGAEILLVNPTAAGWAVAAGSTDKLKVANSDSGAAGIYTIEILGED